MATRKNTTSRARAAEGGEFVPAFDKQAMAEREARASSQDIGQQRRTTLAVLTMSAQELHRAAIDDAATFAAVRDAVAAFADHTSLLRDAATEALLRVSAVGSDGATVH